MVVFLWFSFERQITILTFLKNMVLVVLLVSLCNQKHMGVGQKKVSKTAPVHILVV